MRRVFFVLGSWLSRWQEPVVWLPLSFLALVCAFYAFPAMDPRSGIDGFGSLWGSLLVAFDALLAAFLSWLFLDTYHFTPRDSEERELLDHACGIERSGDDGKRLGHGPQSWPAAFLYVWHQLLWLALFLCIFYRLAR